MSDVAADRFAEPPEVGGGNLRLAARLWASATAFFFIAFLFAYFYLRSLDTHALWHPSGVKAPTTLGTVIAVLGVVGAVATLAGARRLASNDDAGFRMLAGAGLGLGLAVVVLQVVEWSTIGFGPTDGAFAAVFIGWTGLYAAFVLGAMYWLETVVATSFRHRGSSDPSLQLAAGADAAAFFWAVVAGIGVITWVVLYLL
jgi:cytochrome c oxidase subunit III